MVNGSIGLIGGTGLDEFVLTNDFTESHVKTDYGEVLIKTGKIGSQKVIFLNRHGKDYIPPSKINYQANISALKSEGVEVIIAIAAVGSINPKMKPGDFVLLSDFIDFTKARPRTFSDLSFIDLSQPYSPFLIKKITSQAVKLRIKIHKNATYVCTEGPRFETKAEIKMFGKLGADVVGMTNVPEVILANELLIPYAVIGVVTNYAAGISPKRISAKEVEEVMTEKKEMLSRILVKVIDSL